LATRQLLSLLFHEPPRKTAIGAIAAIKIIFFQKSFGFAEAKRKKAAARLKKKGRG
jgi:hypothetical protein